MQQRGGDRAVDSAGHADDYPGTLGAYAILLVEPAIAGRGARSLDSEALAHRAVDILSERQALDIALLDISRSATFTDYFVIATAQSPPQFSALAEHLEKGLREVDCEMRHQEGSANSGWLLLDFGDVIVHIFSPDQRAYYRLEELWGRTAPVVRFTG